MNNKLYGVVAIVLGLVLAGVGGFTYGQSSTLGATINYTNSKNQAVLYNSFESLLQDVTNARAPLAGLKRADVAVNSMSLASSGTALSNGTNATTVLATVTGAVIGDWCFAAHGADTSTIGHTIGCAVTGSNTALVSIVNHATGTLFFATSTLHITAYPSSTFTAPSALVTTSSTSN